jgi:hypothetical protein
MERELLFPCTYRDLLHSLILGNSSTVMKVLPVPKSEHSRVLALLLNCALFQSLAESSSSASFGTNCVMTQFLSYTNLTGVLLCHDTVRVGTSVS